MLRLHRSRGDYLVIRIPGQPDIRVYNAGRNMIGIDAPRHIEIWRSELLEQETEDETGTIHQGR